MRIDLLTLFPQMCQQVLSAGVVGRAFERGILQSVVTDIRSFAGDRHGTVDDSPYGGGAGMVMRCEAVVEAVDSVKREGSPVLLMSPQGKPFQQADANRFAKLLQNDGQIVFLCGRYKGIDERAKELVVTEEFSIGDYILSGGELAALVMIDAIVRRLPGVLGSFDSAETDSFGAGRDGLLDTAHYTRPPQYRGLDVPEVLMSGDHGAIEKWRQQNSLQRTRERRADLLEKREDECSIHLPNKKSRRK